MMELAKTKLLNAALCNVATTLFMTGTCYAAATQEPEKKTEEAIVESPDTRIGTVTIVRNNVFDPTNPEEDKGIYRLVNRLHLKTRSGVVSEQLLFAEGDVYSERTLAESGRLLRGNRYIQEASVEAVQRDDGSVDVNVTTSDVWSLGPKLHYSTSGGESSSSFGLKETNLFGTGMAVELAFESDVDRDSTSISFRDRHLGSSWYDLRTEFAENSDGHTRRLSLEKPFYSLENTNANGFSFYDDDRIDSLYDHGDIAAQFRHQSKSHSAYYGWSKGLLDGKTTRYTAGLAYDDNRFAAIEHPEGSYAVVPEDRTLLYPFIGIDVLQDRFETSRNRDQISRTEDLFVGTRFGARLGVAREQLGSDRDAWLIDAYADTTVGETEKRAVTFHSALATRVERDGVHNLTVNLGTRYDIRQSDKRLFYANLSGTYGHNLDLDKQLLLGGDTGLRGYPLRYQTGDKKILLTLEQRFFTDWYPFRVVNVGAAVFFDAGRTWDSGAYPASNEGLLKDIGVGLRLGNPRSGLGRVIHVDLAFPLDGDSSIKSYQLLVEARASF